MTSPSQVLQAIYVADQDTGDFFTKAMLFDCAERAVIAKRDSAIRVVFEGAPYVIDVLRKRLGREYIESAANGDPQFDDDTVAAYESIAKAYEEISKITSGWVIVNGNQIQVYRDARGRFTSRGKTPTEARTVRETSAFYHPETRSGQGVQGTRVLPKKFEPFLEPGAGPARYRAGGAPEEEDKLVTYGVQAREMGQTITQTMKEKGVLADPANDNKRYRVTASFVSTDGERDEAELRWSGGKDGVYLPPENKDLGWAMEEVYVEPKNAGDAEALGRITTAQEKINIDLGPMAAAAGAAGAPMGLSDKDRSTVLGRNTARANIFSGALEQLGLGRTAAAVRGGAALVGRVDQDPDLRRGLTQTAYRYRAIEAPTIGRDVRMAASTTAVEDGRVVPKDNTGFDEPRKKYYEQRMAAGPLVATDQKFINEALEMGAQRDRLSLLLRKKQIARSPDLSMGVLGNRQTNYSALAQKIAQGVGRGIPSEGVLLDKNGLPVTQSVGIAHDTFLPFNADALSKLKGGQYVRTRQLGGFTGEDLRTLLVGNGRAAQVVSGSGVYELEIDPSVRGKRRYNDRTLQMIDTYDRILDEVSAGGHYVVPLTPQMNAAAETAAAATIRDMERKGTTVSDADKRRIANEARSDQYDKMAVLNESEQKQLIDGLKPGLMADAKERFGSQIRFGSDWSAGVRSAQRSYGSNMDYQQQQAAEEWVNRQLDQAMEDREQEKSRLLTLNSEGYAVALATLQQYYPYMIRTARYRSWPEMNAQSMGQPLAVERLPSKAKDKWYTESGGLLRPQMAGEAGSANANLGLPVSRAERRAAATGARPVTAAGRKPVVAPERTVGPSNLTADFAPNPQMAKTRALDEVARQGRSQAWIEDVRDPENMDIFSATTYTQMTPFTRGRVFMKAITANRANAEPMLTDKANGGLIVEALSDPTTWTQMPPKGMDPTQHKAAQMQAGSMAERVLAATARDRLKASGGHAVEVDSFDIDEIATNGADLVIGRTPAQQTELDNDPGAAPARAMYAAIQSKNIDPAQATSAVDAFRQYGEQNIVGSSVADQPFPVQLQALRQSGVPDDELAVIEVLNQQMQSNAKLTGIDEPNILLDDESASKAKALVALGAGSRYSQVIGGGAGPKVQYQLGKRLEQGWLWGASDPLEERDWQLLRKAYNDEEFRSLRKELLLQDRDLSNSKTSNGSLLNPVRKRLLPQSPRKPSTS